LDFSHLADYFALSRHTSDYVNAVSIGVSVCQSCTDLIFAEVPIAGTILLSVANIKFFVETPNGLVVRPSFAIAMPRRHLILAESRVTFAFEVVLLRLPLLAEGSFEQEHVQSLFATLDKDCLATPSHELHRACFRTF